MALMKGEFEVAEKLSRDSWLMCQRLCWGEGKKQVIANALNEMARVAEAKGDRDVKGVWKYGRVRIRCGKRSPVYC